MGDSFLDQFFSVAFAPEHSRVAVVDGAVGAALYWFSASCGEQRLAYFYGVATAARLQGRGLCRGLMADTRALLEADGCGGILLVLRRCPLFRFYGRLGYTPCCPQGRMRVRAAGPALPLKPVSPRRYGGAPAGPLPRRRPAGGRQPGIPGEPCPALRRKGPAPDRGPAGGRRHSGPGASMPGPHCRAAQDPQGTAGGGGRLSGSLCQGPPIRHVPASWPPGRGRLLLILGWRLIECSLEGDFGPTHEESEYMILSLVSMRTMWSVRFAPGF